MSATEAAEDMDTGLICLVLVSKFHQIPADPGHLQHHFGQSGLHFSNSEILRAAKSLHLKAKSIDSDWSGLEKIHGPVIAKDKDGRYLIIAKIKHDEVLIQDPVQQAPQTLSKTELLQRWSGELILISKRASLSDSLKQFDFSWFIPAILKYKKLTR